MGLFDDAVKFAVDAHSGMVRKAGHAPYILHPMEAASIVGTMTHDEEVLAAAVLHDVVEDTSVTKDEIAKIFGNRVAELVASETENKRKEIPASQSWRIRKEESLKELEESKDIAIKMLWLGDKLSNIRSFYRGFLECGDDFWQNFNQKDKNEQSWYYHKVAKLMEELKDYPAYNEYIWLLKAVFEERK